MQTFLPYPSFAESACVLDQRRLGKQRVEALQILNTLTGRSDGWRNHPAVKMWQGHLDSLCLYGMEMCYEWVRRGYQDTCLVKFVAALHTDWTQMYKPPTWLGDNRLHSSHRAALKFKDPDWYGTFDWSEAPALNYWWPKC